MKEKDMRLTRLSDWNFLNEDDPLFKDLFKQDVDCGSKPIGKDNIRR